MADYRLDCCAGFPNHKQDCYTQPGYNALQERELKVSVLRASGFHPQWITSVLGSWTEPDYYHCRRGCGTLVWDPEAHMKNVCTTFDPVVGT